MHSVMQCALDTRLRHRSISITIHHRHHAPIVPSDDDDEDDNQDEELPDAEVLDDDALDLRHHFPLEFGGMHGASLCVHV